MSLGIFFIVMAIALLTNEETSLAIKSCVVGVICIVGASLIKWRWNKE